MIRRRNTYCTQKRTIIGVKGKHFRRARADVANRNGAVVAAHLDGARDATSRDAGATDDGARADVANRPRARFATRDRIARRDARRARTTREDTAGTC